MLRGRISLNRKPAAQDPNAWVAQVYEADTGRIRFQHSYPTRNDAMQAITHYMDKEYHDGRADEAAGHRASRQMA